MTAAAVPAIQTHSLAMSFGKTQALAPLDLIVPRGAIFALVGHNGAGKTTLIKLLMNILQPTGGSASVLGMPSETLAGPSLTQIGYVSENQELPEWMTVQGFMDYLRPFYPTWNDTNLLRNLDLPPDRKLKNLSRGMKMKAALASVLAFRPPLILMDEPFSGLDPLVRDELIEALIDTMNAEGQDVRPTILISSHDLAEVESFATHVGFLHQGRLLFAEPMETMAARFREVTVTLNADSPAPVLKNLPASWLLPEHTASIVRFVHTEATSASFEEQIRTFFPNAVSIEAEPMNLRTIFLTLVKSGRTQQDRSRA